MRGVADHRKVDRERVLYGAWSGDFFRRQEKLKPFPDYVKIMLPREPKRRASGDELLAQFEAIRASGVPMTIRRVG